MKSDDGPARGSLRASKDVVRGVDRSSMLDDAVKIVEK